MKTKIEIVRSHYEASARGDIDAMMADVSPQVRWTEMASGELRTVHGYLAGQPGDEG